MASDKVKAHLENLLTQEACSVRRAILEGILANGSHEYVGRIITMTDDPDFFETSDGSDMVIFSPDIDHAVDAAENWDAYMAEYNA